jgi:hypothetical protein
MRRGRLDQHSISDSLLANRLKIPPAKNLALEYTRVDYRCVFVPCAEPLSHDANNYCVSYIVLLSLQVEVNSDYKCRPVFVKAGVNRTVTA